MKAVFALLLIIGSSAKIVAQPNYNQAIGFAFSSYSDEEYWEGFYTINYRPDGWHFGKIEYKNPNTILEDKLIWSVATDDWIPSERKDKAAVDKNKIQSKIDDFKTNSSYRHDSSMLSVNKYYGYPGWDWDVIKDLSSKENLNNKELEQYARACSNYAQGFFTNQYGLFFDNNNPHRKELTATAQASSNRADSFSHYLETGIACYETLAKRDPDYKTIVGKIGDKLNNERVYAFYNLSMMNFTEEGSLFLKDVNYSDSILNANQERLDILKDGDILFTSGDSEHYPALYLQYKKKLHKKIILNVNMLMLIRYTDLMKRKYPDLAFTIPDTVHHKYDLYYTAINEEQYSPLHWNDFIQQLSASEATNKGYSLTSKYLTFETIAIDINNQSKTFDLGRYFTRGDLVQLDIIQSNAKSKIYTTYPGDFCYQLAQYQANHQVWQIR